MFKNGKLLRFSFILLITILIVFLAVLFSNNGQVLIFLVGVLSIFNVSLVFWLNSKKDFSPSSNAVSTQHIQNQFIIEQIRTQIHQAFFILLPNEKILLSSTFNVTLFNREWTTMEDVKEFPTLWSNLQQALAIETGSTIEWDFEKKRIQSRIIPLKFESTFFGLFVMSSDITHQFQLDQVQTEFLADISHELKTPLAAIIGASDILNRPDAKLSPKQRISFLEIVEKESGRMKRLIDELTHLSRLDNSLFSTLIKSEFSLKELLLDVEQVHRPALEERHLYLTIDKSCETIVFLDRDKAFQIFSNLVSNAIRYTQKGGITINAQVINKHTIISVSDSGAGIEPQNLPRIFDRFFRTDFARNRVEGGSGLGLAITRAIIEAHKGTIQVKSTFGVGTTFILSLPNLS